MRKFNGVPKDGFYIDNLQDITFSGDVDTNEKGVPWTRDEFEIYQWKILQTTEKNCTAMRDGPYYLYVKKGTSCTIDATFEEDEKYRAKTETITIYADK